MMSHVDDKHQNVSLVRSVENDSRKFSVAVLHKQRQSRMGNGY